MNYTDTKEDKAAADILAQAFERFSELGPTYTIQTWIASTHAHAESVEKFYSRKQPPKGKEEYIHYAEVFLARLFHEAQFLQDCAPLPQAWWSAIIVRLGTQITIASDTSKLIQKAELLINEDPKHD